MGAALSAMRGHEAHKARTIDITDVMNPCVTPPPARLPRNRVKTQKYTWWTYPWLSIVRQFFYFFNQYFLATAVMQFYPPLKVGITFTYWLPLVLILVLSVGKEGYDDYHRYKRDRAVNDEPYAVVASSRVNGGERVTIVPRPSAKLVVGDIIFLEANQNIPADVVLLAVLNDETCFIRTDNLDGESDLRIKLPLYSSAQLFGERPSGDPLQVNFRADFGNLAAVKGKQKLGLPRFLTKRSVRRMFNVHALSDARANTSVADLATSLERARNVYNGVYAIERPTKNIYSFKGTLTKPAPGAPGKAVQAAQGAQGGAGKGASVTPLTLNNTIWSGSTLCTDLVMALVINTGRDTRMSMNILKPRSKFGKTDLESNLYVKALFLALLVLALFCLMLSTERTVVNYIRWMLLFSSFIPTSFKVALDFGKVFITIAINHDSRIPGIAVRSTEIPEELGRISYLFTDKTGTLTCNRMSVRELHIRGTRHTLEGMMTLNRSLPESLRTLRGGALADDAAAALSGQSARSDYLQSLDDPDTTLLHEPAAASPVRRPGQASGVPAYPPCDDSDNSLLVGSARSVHSPGALPRAASRTASRAVVGSAPTAAPAGTPSRFMAGLDEFRAAGNAAAVTVGSHGKEGVQTAAGGPEDTTGSRTHTEQMQAIRSVASAMLQQITTVADASIDMAGMDRMQLTFLAMCTCHSVRIRTAAEQQSAQKRPARKNGRKDRRDRRGKPDKSERSDRRGRDTPLADELGLSKGNSVVAAIPELPRSSRTAGADELTTSAISATGAAGTPGATPVSVSRPEPGHGSARPQRPSRTPDRRRAPPVKALAPTQTYRGQNVLLPLDAADLALVDNRSSYQSPGDSTTETSTSISEMPSLHRLYDGLMAYLSTLFQASSPDELALVKYAYIAGYRLLRRTEDAVDLTVLQDVLSASPDRGSTPPQLEPALAAIPTAVLPPPDAAPAFVPLHFEVLREFPFSSAMKRMGVLVRCREDVSGRVYLFVKGADSAIVRALDRGDRGDGGGSGGSGSGSGSDAAEEERLLTASVDNLARQGLRTLVFAYRTLAPADAAALEARYQAAMTDLERREELYAQYEDAVFSRLRLLCCTGIEDELQRDVPSTISMLKGAGIHTWVLSGDRVETVQAISASCGLVDKDTCDYFYMTEQVIGNDYGRAVAALRDLEALTRRHEAQRSARNVALVIDGQTIETLLGHHPVNYFLRYTLRHAPAPVLAPRCASFSGRGSGRGSGGASDGEASGVSGATGASCAPGTPGLATRPALVPLHFLVVGWRVLRMYMYRYVMGHFPHGPGSLYGRRNGDVREEFADVTSRIFTVVACRCTPDQKSLISSLITRYTNKQSLGIGDGSNDVSLLTSCSVGVGLRGLEGSQAANSADFAADNFGCLRDLLFYHGRHAYMNSTTLIQNVLMRGMTQCFMQLFFSTCYYMTTTILYTGTFLVFYPTLYTILPTMTYYIDEDIDYEDLMRHPELYATIKRGHKLNIKTFFCWTGLSVYIMWALMGGFLFFNPRADFYDLVVTTFTPMVLCQSLLAVMLTKRWTSFMASIIAISVAVVYLTIFVLPSYWGSWYILTARYWYTHLALTGFAMGPVFCAFWAAKKLGLTPLEWRMRANKRPEVKRVCGRRMASWVHNRTSYGSYFLSLPRALVDKILCRCCYVDRLRKKARDPVGFPVMT